MIKVELYKHNSMYDLEKHIEYSIMQGKKLLSVSTKDTFWSFSLYNKESTITWEY